MFNTMKKKFAQWLIENRNLKNQKFLLDKNYEFLKSIDAFEKRKLFEFLKSYGNISYSNTSFYDINFSPEFNEFFSIYKKISIGNNNPYIISKEKINYEHSYDKRLIIIGSDDNYYIFITKDNNSNLIFLEEIDSEDDLNRNDTCYSTIYHFLIDNIACTFKLDLNFKYKEMLSINSPS